MGQDNRVSIKSIINEVMLEENNNSKQDFIRYEQFALRCLQELNTFHLPCFETFIATPNPNGVIQLPSDFLDYLMIGTVINGKKWTFTKDKKLIVQDIIDVCDCEEGEASFNLTSGTSSNTTLLPTLRVQTFTGIEGNNSVEVTLFNLNDAYLPFINDLPVKSNTTRSINKITFLTPFVGGEIIEIYN